MKKNVSSVIAAMPTGNKNKNLRVLHKSKKLVQSIQSKIRRN